MKLVHLRAGRFSFVWHREPHHVISRSCDCVCLFHSFFGVSQAPHPCFSCCCLPFAPLYQQGRAGPGSLQPQSSVQSYRSWFVWAPDPPGVCSSSLLQPEREQNPTLEPKRAQMGREKKITETPLISERFPGTCPWKPHGSRGRRPKEILSLCSPVPADALPDGGGSLLFHVCSFASEKKKN